MIELENRLSDFSTGEGMIWVSTPEEYKELLEFCSTHGCVILYDDFWHDYKNRHMSFIVIGNVSRETNVLLQLTYK